MQVIKTNYTMYKYVILLCLINLVTANADISQADGSNNTYNISFRDVSLGDVVRQFGNLPGVVLVVNPTGMSRPEMDEKVFAEFDGITWQQGLNEIISGFGLCLHERAYGEGVWVIERHPLSSSPVLDKMRESRSVIDFVQLIGGVVVILAIGSLFTFIFYRRRYKRL